MARQDQSGIYKAIYFYSSAITTELIWVIKAIAKAIISFEDLSDCDLYKALTRIWIIQQTVYEYLSYIVNYKV